ncbi:hypothetical protein AAG570_004218 [Ranatra chinensis]|uniref:C3H1-type domain-containing protein n=1 Tax=Ranatra chinensis TaxID=642074 RepID=A0ABD0YRS0_9HEMI
MSGMVKNSRCDADPAALAKYVYALVKKDKPVDDLKASMIEQLEVFLQKETHGFVELLFRTLETQVYDTKEEPQPIITASPTIPAAAAKGAMPDVDLREPLPAPTDEIDRKIPIKEPVLIVALLRHSFLHCSTPYDRIGCRKRKREAGEVEEGVHQLHQKGGGRGQGHMKEGGHVQEIGIGPGPGETRVHPPADMRGGEHTLSHLSGGILVRGHLPTKGGGTGTGRHLVLAPGLVPDLEHVQGVLLDSLHLKFFLSCLDTIERKDVNIVPPARDPHHGDTDLRLGAASQSIQSVVAVPTEIPPTYPTRRCRDFDEKGFCMRGDLCPYDHGTDPVILEDVGVMYNGSGPTQPPLAPPTHPGHPTVDSLHLTAPPIRPPQPITTNLLVRGSMARGVMGRGNFGPHQRELINVVTGGGPPYRNPRPHANTGMDVSDGRITTGIDNGKRGGGFDFNRLGASRMPRPPLPIISGNSSLQLKKVPVGVNNITHLNNHFSKFGKILKIQVGFEGDPESALITFSNHTEANIAYKSTEAVLNNRFIRVYWYNPNNNNNSNSNNNNENKQENMPPTPRPSVLERLGAPPAKVLNNLQPSAIVQQEEKVVADALKKKEEEEIIKEKKKKQEEARKQQGLKLNADLRKRKQELLEKQLNQQKLLINRLEAENTSSDQKVAIMGTVKTLQDSIENLRKDLELTVKATFTKTKGILTKEHLDLVKKTREETQRELLDAELDLHNRQHEGKDTIELKKKVADLKLKAFSLGVSPLVPRSTPYVRGRGTFRARGRGRGSRFIYSGSYDHNVVDHRPTKLLVSGYEQDDKADVLAHFAQYGEIADYISDDATPSLVLNFKLRKEAEVAITKGRNFQDRLLSVTWATHNHTIRSGVATKNHRSVMVVDEEGVEDVLEEADDEEEIVGLMSPDALLQDEEEDDEEDRSWRR